MRRNIYFNIEGQVWHLYEDPESLPAFATLRNLDNGNRRIFGGLHGLMQITVDEVMRIQDANRARQQAPPVQQNPDQLQVPFNWNNAAQGQVRFTTNWTQAQVTATNVVSNWIPAGGRAVARTQAWWDNARQAQADPEQEMVVERVNFDE